MEPTSQTEDEARWTRILEPKVGAWFRHRKNRYRVQVLEVNSNGTLRTTDDPQDPKLYARVLVVPCPGDLPKLDRVQSEVALVPWIWEECEKPGPRLSFWEHIQA